MARRQVKYKGSGKREQEGQDERCRNWWRLLQGVCVGLVYRHMEMQTVTRCTTSSQRVPMIL